MALPGEPTIAQVVRAAENALAIWSRTVDKGDTTCLMLDLLVERLPSQFTRTQIMAADEYALTRDPFNYGQEFAAHLLDLKREPPTNGDTP